MSAPAKPLRPETGVVPPQDMDAEAYVLSACILKPELYDVVTSLGLTADAFYADRHKVIFQTIAGLHEHGTPIDVGTVILRMRDQGTEQRAGGSPYLVQIVDSAPALLDAHVEAYAKTVRDKARLRQMVAVLRQHAAEAFGAVEDTQAFLDIVETNVSEVARQFEGRRGLVQFAAPAEQAYARVAEASHNGRAPGVPFGLERLDRKTSGMGDGDLIVVAGRPGMGKTAFVVGAAAHIAALQPDAAEASLEGPGAVAFFSLEMGADQLALRAICSDARLDSHRIRNGFVRGDEWPRLVDSTARIAKLPIWVDDTPGVSIADIRSRCRKLKSDLDREREKDPTAPRLRLVAIDYLQLVGGPLATGRALSREQEVSANTRASKELAKELGCPVLLLSQLNRSVETRGKDKRPQLSDLRESGAIEQDADQVLFIYRDDYYFPDSVDRGVAEIIVAKQRNGPGGTVKVRFAGEYTRFDNLASDDYDDLDDYDDFATEATL